MEKTIHSKIFEIQSLGLTVSKNATNPFHKSRYADYSQVMRVLQPELTRLRLVQLFPIKEGQIYLELKDLDSGEIITSSLPTGTGNPQQIGSNSTYFKRYLTVCLFNMIIEGDDEDGNNASGKGLEFDLQESKKKNEELQASIKEKDKLEKLLSFCEKADTLDRLVVLTKNTIEKMPNYVKFIKPYFYKFGCVFFDTDGIGYTQDQVNAMEYEAEMAKQQN